MNFSDNNISKIESIISVIIPVYNSAITIERCIKSVINQNILQNEKDYSHQYKIEIIVIDDGSTDDSVKVTNQLFNKTNSIDNLSCKLIKQENKGPSSARNSGIKEATGDWIYFLDSDDTLTAECFSKLLSISENYYDKHQSYPDIILPRALAIENNNPYKHKFTENIYELEDYLKIAELISSIIQDDEWKCRYPLFYSCGKMIRSCLIKDNQVWFDESIRHAEDAKFGADMIKHVSSICVIDKPLYNYIFSQSSLSTANRDAIQSLHVGKQFEKSIVETFNKWNVYDKFPEINNHVIKMLEIFLIDSIRQNEINFKETKHEIKTLFNDDYYQSVNKMANPKLFYDRVIKLIIRLKLANCCVLFIKFCRRFKLFQG